MAENFVEDVAVVVDLLILVEEVRPVECVVGAESMLVKYVDEVLEEFWTVYVFVCGVVMPGENDGDDVPVETVIDVPVAVVVKDCVVMLVVLEEFWTVGVLVDSVFMPVENNADVAKECVVMLVVLEEFQTLVVLVCGVVMPVDSVFKIVENNGDGVLIEIAFGVLDKLSPVGEFWTVDVEICVILLVEKTEDAPENIVEGAAVVLNMLEEKITLVDATFDAVVMVVENIDVREVVEVFVVGDVDKLVTMEGFWTVLVSGVVMPLENVGEDVPVDNVVRVGVLEEFWTVGVLVDSVLMPVENNGDRVLVEIVVGVVDKLLPEGEFWTVDVVTCVNLLVEESEGVTENFFEGVAVVLNMLEEEISFHHNRIF
ncbi:hypothetical protein ROHU_022609 [Labeo rohita]|uniref:Uncharacterized protein n=1 Tax=Labeo rohita TaxID=84645 RepID=A0A498MSY4_LABRO|nr:hypothetical protein ROHU_022609 [Labeo rohita]